MYYPKRKIPWYKKLWKLRYRFYALVFILILLPIWYAGQYGVAPSVGALEGTYEVVSENLFAQKVEPKKIEIVEVEEVEERYAVQVNSSGALEFKVRTGLDLGANNPNTEGMGVRDLSSIIGNPSNPSTVNFLQYPKYNVSAPIIYSELSDLYKTEPNGELSRNENGALIPQDLAGTESPIQLKLREGVVHIAFTPQPGEYLSDTAPGCYIVGHSSNYSFVRSNYNTVFAPLKQKTKPGETFIIYDRFGRKLNFRVFEALKIAEEDVQTAYKAFPGRRVCTLQTSVLGWRNGRLEATHRWLTRGYLIDEEGDEIKA